MPIVRLPVDLHDGAGFRWDIQSNGSISNGTWDAFDGGFRLANLYPLSTALTESEDGGREIEIGPFTQSVAGDIRVDRKIYVPHNDSFARFFDSVTNTGDTTLTYRFQIETNLGSDSRTTVVGTSSGDFAVTTDDMWIVTDDRPGIYTDPAVAHVFGNGSGISPAAVLLSRDNLIYRFDLTLAPGETQSILHFGVQRYPQDVTINIAEQLAALGRGALDGLSNDEVDQIVNFDTSFVAAPLDLDGGATPDFMQGSLFADTLEGFGGNDTIFGASGDDILSGGDGDDSIDGGRGSDTINGGDGRDTLAGGDQDDYIMGDGGDDIIFGDGGNDTLLGGADDESIEGGVGADIVFAGAGNDTVHGDSAAATVALSENDRINGMDGDDLLMGGHGQDTIAGQAGNDTIIGGGGFDLLFGGDGDDFIFGGYGSNNRFGPDDRVWGGDGADKFFSAGVRNSITQIMDYDASEGDTLVLDGLLFQASDFELYGVQSIQPNIPGLSFRPTELVRLDANGNPITLFTFGPDFVGDSIVLRLATPEGVDIVTFDFF